MASGTGEVLGGELLDEDGNAVYVFDEHGQPAAVPERTELIKLGNAALATIDLNPDDVVPEEVLRFIEQWKNPKTRATYQHMWGMHIWLSGRLDRDHLPCTRATLVTEIYAMYNLVGKDGRGRGRDGRPYSPRTAELLAYTVSAVHQRKGFVSPVKDLTYPSVADALDAYAQKYAASGYRPFKSDALLLEHSMALRRACDLRTIQGLRLAAATALQWDMGARASEILGLRLEDLSWPDDGLLRVWIGRSKTDQDARGRAVLVEHVDDEYADVDAEHLVGLYVAELAERGITSGPMWLDVNPAPPRKDGKISGSVVPGSRWTMDGYELAFGRIVKKAVLGTDPKTGKPIMLAVDPKTKRKRHITTQSNRSGHITEAVNNDIPVQKVAARTGHSLNSGVIHGYYRSGEQVGENNSGSEIRRRKARKKATKATGAT